jgi:hypothetical protein
MKTRESILAAAQAEIEKAEKEGALIQWLRDLNVECKHVSLHTWKDQPAHFSATVAKAYPNRHTFAEAFSYYEKTEKHTVPAERWRDGSLSIRPAEINSSAANPRATMDGQTWASVVISAGKGYQSHELNWWVRSPFGLVQIKVELCPPWKWLPQISEAYDPKSGEATRYNAQPPSLGEDCLTKWWSPPGSYQFQYQWADAHNFRAFASTQIPTATKLAKARAELESCEQQMQKALATLRQ